MSSELLAAAANDRRLSGGAITGSAAIGEEDRWSDIDLAFGVAEGVDMSAVVADWTAHMYREYLALHHVDVLAGSWVYRVFLLPGTLQVDLAFAPAQDFRAKASTFKLIFGEAEKPAAVLTSSPDAIIGLGWLYALHARTCIARQKRWQAEYMISGVRDHALALACLRHGLPVSHGRGIDQLPSEVAGRFTHALVRNLEAGELLRAFQAAILGFLEEIKFVDVNLAERLSPSLASLIERQNRSSFDDT